MVPPLSHPQISDFSVFERWKTYEAIQLFVQRARMVFPQFQVTIDNIASLVQICQRLDGIPLALELAAARAKILTVEEIATRLDQRFRLLTTGNRTSLPRHQTLQAMVDWSWELLSAKEQALLRRLSIFAGVLTLPAAESVCKGGPIADFEVLDILTQLVNKSLVIAERSPGQKTRYKLLETIKQYSVGKLTESGEKNLIRQQHFDYYLQFAERAEPEFRKSDQVLWRNRVAEEMNNFRVALDWSLDIDVEGSLRLICLLWSFWGDHGYIQEIEESLGYLLSNSKNIDLKIKAKALIVQSDFNTYLSNMEKALRLANESMALYQECDDQAGIADALFHLAIVTFLFDMNRGYELFKESLAAYRALDFKFGMASALYELGLTCEARAFNNYVQADVYLQECKSICQTLGFESYLAGVNHAFALIAIMQKRLQDCPAFIKRSILNLGTFRIKSFCLCL